jgi:inorganic pyrophosphatase
MDIKKIPAGKNPPSEINVFIEIPQGSSIKYELDKELGIIKVDRILYTSMFYPFNYGFIPNTQADDGDPVDVLLISSMPFNPGVIVSSRPIGLLEMEDEAGLDNKIIAVPEAKVDPVFAATSNAAEDLDEYIKQRIKHFFESYKELEPGKWVKAKEFIGKEKAEEEIKKFLI